MALPKNTAPIKYRMPGLHLINEIITPKVKTSLPALVTVR